MRNLAGPYLALSNACKREPRSRAAVHLSMPTWRLPKGFLLLQWLTVLFATHRVHRAHGAAVRRCRQSGGRVRGVRRGLRLGARRPGGAGAEGSFALLLAFCGAVQPAGALGPLLLLRKSAAACCAIPPPVAFLMPCHAHLTHSLLAVHPCPVQAAGTVHSGGVRSDHSRGAQRLPRCGWGKGTL